jgi:UDP-2,3-diacylglucosamine hydrolase
MSKSYFISDAHLGLGPKDEERQKESRLLAFLDNIKNDATRLFIVGDLFDAWLEYRTVIPKGFHRLFTKLEEFSSLGITIHYLAGNHDYWMRNFFHDELGMKTYLDAFHITVDGKKVFLHHGDGLAVKDTGYRILKFILRHPFNIWLYSWLHPDLGVALARSSSKKSRRYTAAKDYSDDNGMERFAGKKIASGFDIVIMGHRHQPVQKQIGNGLYINLGDWISHNTYAVMENGCIELKKWDE